MERLALDRWASPWLRYQHLARYQWARQFTRGRRVLDAACGTAFGARMLRDGGAERVDCIDYSFDAFRAARRLKDLDALALVVADVTRLPLRSGSYDVYASFETIEHVDDRPYLAEACRVLKPGGTFLCSTPNRELVSPGNSLSERPSNPFHLREYSLDEFERLLGEFFSGVRLFGQTRFSQRHHELLRSVSHRSRGLAMRLHQMRKIVGLPAEKPERHIPKELPFDGEPEVLIAVCTR